MVMDGSRRADGSGWQQAATGEQTAGVWQYRLAIGSQRVVSGKGATEL